jgi:hypothetical protein
MSASVPSGVEPNASSVFGEMTVIRPDDAGSRQPPPMKKSLNSVVIIADSLYLMM